MLGKLTESIANAYRRAADCAEKAARATSPEVKASYLRMERGWLKLAQSYELSERLERFINEFARRRNTVAPVNQVQLYTPPCSKCGSLTVLRCIEPADQPGHDLRTFGCDLCGQIETILAKI